MVLFRETSELSNGLELYDKDDEFRNIKSEGSMSLEEADEFWDSIFSVPDKNWEMDVSTEIFGRDDSEFTFDIDISCGNIRELLNKYDTEYWDNYTDEEKQLIIKETSTGIAGLLYIENIPNICFYTANSYSCGAFIPNTNEIRINAFIFNDSNEVLNTIAHEMRHAYQYERAQKLENYEDLLYARNFENYISPIITKDGCINFNEYQDQLVEAEARAFADVFTEGRI